MPPKIVTCAICTNTVLKAATLARADGSRACRTHEGVAEDADKRQNEERNRLENEIKKANRPLSERFGYGNPTLGNDFEKQANEFREQVYSHCWICNADGLEGGEFFIHAMIAMKRLELRGEFDFFNLGKGVRSLMGNVVLLLPFKLQNEVIDRALVKHVVNHKIRDLVPLLGFVLMCPQCANKHGFKKRLDDLIPKPTWEQVQRIMPIVDGMDTLLHALAEKKEGQS